MNNTQNDKGFVSKLLADLEEGGDWWSRLSHLLENHKAIGFLRSIGLDLLENQKDTKPAFIVGSSSAPQQSTI